MPELVARHVAAFVAGMQGAGVAACAKHFPGHGDTREDSHHELPTVEPDAAAFDAALLPFRAAIEAGVRAVMTAHIRVPALDDAPATLSRRSSTGCCAASSASRARSSRTRWRCAASAPRSASGRARVRSLTAGADALLLGHDLGEECGRGRRRGGRRGGP